METYSYQKFIELKAMNKIQFNVNPYIRRKEVEAKLPQNYHQSVVISSGVSVLILILALPVYLMVGWILGVLTFAGAIMFFEYTRSHNYRVFVRAQVKDDAEFYEYALKKGIIDVYEINQE